MNRRAATILLVTIFLLAIATLFLRRDGADDGDVATVESERIEIPGASVPIELYFPDERGRLSSERREVPATKDAPGRMRAVLDELFIGPETEGLFAPLAPPVEVGSIHVSETGVAFVDLISIEHATPPVAGTRDELLTLYSLVNSLLLNTPEVASIVFLWNGQQLESFAGHIDTTRPLVANENL